MRLTKIQRHTAYILMLANSDDSEDLASDGFCFMIYKLFGIDNYGFYDGWYSPNLCYEVLNFFPELLKKKPKTTTYHGLWFDENDWKSRKKILKQCISETY